MKLIPYIKVSDTKEYFSLPNKEREWYGFYRLPYSLPFDFLNDNQDGWDFFYKEIKKQYPVQYFFRRWILSPKNPVFFCFLKYIKWPFFDLKSKITNFMNPCYRRWRKTIPRYSYADVSYLTVESNFNLILDFYYEEVVNGHVDWQSDDVHKQFYEELTKNVKWIEVDRKKWEEEKDEELSIATRNKAEKDYNKKYEKYNRYEKIIYDKESEILKWFIEKRGFFWT